MRVMTEKMEIAVQAIRQFVYFTYNYPSPRQICEGVWGDQKLLCEHLYKKLVGYMENSKYESALNRFYIELSVSHQHELAEWIVRNYDGVGPNKAVDDGVHVTIGKMTKALIDKAYEEYNEFCLMFGNVEFSDVDGIVREKKFYYGAETPSMGNGMADINYKSILATVIRKDDGKVRVSNTVEVYTDDGIIRYVCENFDKYMENKAKIVLV